MSYKVDNRVWVRDRDEGKALNVAILCQIKRVPITACANYLFEPIDEAGRTDFWGPLRDILCLESGINPCQINHVTRSDFERKSVNALLSYCEILVDITRCKLACDTLEVRAHESGLTKLMITNFEDADDE